MSGRPISECRNAWDWAHVTATGDVRPCCYALRPVGNVVAAGGFDEVWNGPTLRDVRRSIVEGFVAPSCRGAGCRFARDTERRYGLAAYRLDYRLGTMLTVATDDHHLLDGWCWPEPWGVWSISTKVRVALRLVDDFTEDLELVFFASAFLPLPEDSLDVPVRANGQPLGTVAFRREDGPSFEGDYLCFGGNLERRLLVPREVARDPDGLVVLELDIDRPRSLLELGLGADDRRIGLGLTRLALVAKASGLASSSASRLSPEPMLAPAAPISG
jgi:Iron-sulfur cluster-binding domain